MLFRAVQNNCKKFEDIKFNIFEDMTFQILWASNKCDSHAPRECCRKELIESLTTPCLRMTTLQVYIWVYIWAPLKLWFDLFHFTAGILPNVPPTLSTYHFLVYSITSAWSYPCVPFITMCCFAYGLAWKFNELVWNLNDKTSDQIVARKACKVRVWFTNKMLVTLRYVRSCNTYY